MRLFIAIELPETRGRAPHLFPRLSPTGPAPRGEMGGC